MALSQTSVASHTSHAGHAGVLATNKVLRNTYLLLSATLAFSAFTALVSLAAGVGPWLGLALMIGALGLLVVIHLTANSGWGLWATFAFTGLLGAALGPILRGYLALPQGPSLVIQAFGGTGLAFLAVSAYAMHTRRDFSSIGGFLLAGLVTVIVAMVANLFLNIPALSLALSAVVTMLMCGYILYHTQQLISGGERNYILATIGLYLSIYNLFTSLLHLLSALSGND